MKCVVYQAGKPVHIVVIFIGDIMTDFEKSILLLVILIVVVFICWFINSWRNYWRG